MWKGVRRIVRALLSGEPVVCDLRTGAPGFTGRHAVLVIPAMVQGHGTLTFVYLPNDSALVTTGWQPDRLDFLSAGFPREVAEVLAAMCAAFGGTGCPDCKEEKADGYHSRPRRIADGETGA